MPKANTGPLLLFIFLTVWFIWLLGGSGNQQRRDRIMYYYSKYRYGNKTIEQWAVPNQ
jgi:hypothetical protein